jgi:predicted methyltransferase
MKTYSLRLQEFNNHHEIVVDIVQKTPYDAIKVAEQIYGEWYKVQSISEHFYALPSDRI